MTQEKNQISRRAVAKGAAWTVPAIVAAGAVPVAAATPPTGCTEIEDDIEVAPGSTNNYFNNYERTVYTWTNTYGVPLQVTYDVAGGGGGVNWNDGAQTGSEPGGSGHRLTGMLLVPAGVTLTLIAGNGGIGVSDVGNAPGAPAMNAVIKGGAGYGNGGDMTLGDQPYRYAAGSGGGGSAILVGTGSSAKPIIVAGGGGGAGGGIASSPPFVFTQDASGGHGGNPGLTGGAARGRIGSGASQANYVAQGGGGANGATGGQPYANHAEGNPAGDFTYTGVGTAGANHGGNGINGGGNGAHSTVPPAWAYVARGAGQYTPGAGGGGYAGGASANWTTARASVPAGGAVIGGGGGGGSSFVATGLVDSVTVVASTGSLANNGTSQPRTRNPGWARIAFGACV